MSLPRQRLRPGVEWLDARVVMSTALLNPPTHLTPGQYPSADAHRAFTTADLQAYAAAYETYQGSPGYTPQYDFNGTGFIGQNDATPILRGLAAITPDVPLKLTLALAPGEQVTGPHPSNSGGVTRLATVTIVGKTTPNSIIFTDGPATNTTLPTNNFKFHGLAVVSDAQGNFEFTTKLNAISRGGSETNAAFLVRTPFGQQTIRAFPVRLLP
jgi:hypothetical protein